MQRSSSWQDGDNEWHPAYSAERCVGQGWADQMSRAGTEGWQPRAWRRGPDLLGDNECLSSFVSSFQLCHSHLVLLWQDKSGMWAGRQTTCKKITRWTESPRIMTHARKVIKRGDGVECVGTGSGGALLRERVTRKRWPCKDILQQRKQQVQSQEAGRGSGCSPTLSDAGFPRGASLVLGPWACEGGVVSQVTGRRWWPCETVLTVGGHGEQGWRGLAPFPACPCWAGGQDSGFWKG